MILSAYGPSLFGSEQSDSLCWVYETGSRDDHEMRKGPRCFPRSLTVLLWMVRHARESEMRGMFELKSEKDPLGSNPPALPEILGDIALR